MATFPVRCFTCGKVLRGWCNYEEKVITNKQSQDVVLDEMGYIRACCRRMYITHPYKIERGMMLYASSLPPKDVTEEGPINSKQIESESDNTLAASSS